MRSVNMTRSLNKNMKKTIILNKLIHMNVKFCTATATSIYFSWFCGTEYSYNIRFCERSQNYASEKVENFGI